MPGDVDDQITDRQLLRRRLLRPAQPRPDPGHELLGLERLDDVVVRARLQADHHVDRVALRRQHHDRHAGLGSDQPADLNAVTAGQHQIEQYKIGFGLPKSSERFVAVRYERRLETLTTKHDSEHLGQCCVVVDDQDASLHIDIIPLPDRDLAHSSAKPVSVTGERTPFSVTIAVTNSGGVISNAGL